MLRACVNFLNQSCIATHIYQKQGEGQDDDGQSKATKISSIRDNVATSINKTDTFKAKKVLVAMIGIGKYNSNVLPNLIGVSRDYCNVKYTFNVKRGCSL